MPTVVSFLGSLILIIETVIAYQILLTPRFSKVPTYLILTLGIIIYNSAYLFPHSSPLHTIVPIFGFYISILITYKNRFLQTTFIYLAVTILEATVEFINVFIQPKGMMADWPNGASIQRQIVTCTLFIFALAVLLAVFIVIVQRIRRKSSKFYGTREAVIFSVLLLVELVILVFVYQIACANFSSKLFVLLLAITLAFTIADFAVFFSVASIARRQAESTRADMLEQMVQAQGEYYAALTEQQESIRAMRHDIANHILTMKLLLNENKDADVSGYLDDLQDKYKSNSKLGTCQNSVVDAFIYHKISQLRMKGVTVSANINISDSLSISNTDLISAFGNLIDNCAEACALVENPSIDITAYVRSGYLRIETVNPVPAVIPEEKKRRIPELERGVGTHILNSLAARYDGQFKSCSENGNYKAELILKV